MGPLQLNEVKELFDSLDLSESMWVKRSKPNPIRSNLDQMRFHGSPKECLSDFEWLGRKIQ